MASRSFIGSLRPKQRAVALAYEGPDDTIFHGISYKTCPACVRKIEVINGIWTQHTDPATWGTKAIKQCRLARKLAQ